MKKRTKREEWLCWFKLTARMAARYRLDGRIERAQHADSILESYYAESGVNGYYDEDALYGIEQECREAER